VTIDEACEKAAAISELNAELQAEFPCEECGGDGGDDGCSVYPEPCSNCWGRGWHIPEEDE
jgi:DnaJ-class molecular chaperone